MYKRSDRGRDSMHIPRATWAVVGVLMLATAACSSSSSSSSSAAAPEGGIAATEADFSIALDSTSVPSGDVSFSIENQGPSAHEFVIVQTDLAPDALPVKDNEVEEDQLTIVDEAEDIAPSTTADLTTNLDPGSYVIICNVTAHYEQGMRAGLTVT
jgi:uncharacterized cupredoxin-like copper-binding protein